MTRAAERALLVVLVAVVVVPRLVLSACVTDLGVDGGYYTDIALNVAEGNGLTTDVSVFHQGFPRFPHPTPVYPLWPLVYGLAAKVAPIAVVGVWLPTALYFAATALAYRLGHRLAPRRLVQPLPLHGGHVLALLFALTSELAPATARPYTEGLAFVLLFGLLLRGPALWGRLGLTAGMELGLWLVVLFLTRSQLVVVGIAAGLACGLAAARRPREAATFLLGAVGVAAVVWQAYAAWLGTFLPHPTLATYLRFDSARVPSALSVVPVMAEATTPLERLTELAQGLGAAFDLSDSVESYWHLHRASIHAVPAAAVVLALRWRRWPIAARLLRSRAGPNAAFFTLTALGLMASLHTVHKVYGSAWVFGGRHAIPSVLLVGAAVLYLLRVRVPLARAVGASLLAAGLYAGWRGLVLQADNQCSERLRGATITSYRPRLRGFLEDERDRLGGLTVAVERPEAQRLAWRVPEVGFHWLTETTTPDDLGILVRDLGVRYVVLFDEVHNDRLGKSAAFARGFVLADTFEEGGPSDEDGAARARGGKLTRVYAPRCAEFPGAPTCRDGGSGTAATHPDRGGDRDPAGGTDPSDPAGRPDPSDPADPTDGGGLTDHPNPTARPDPPRAPADPGPADPVGR